MIQSRSIQLKILTDNGNGTIHYVYDSATGEIEGVGSRFENTPSVITRIRITNAQLGEASTVTGPTGIRTSFSWSSDGQPLTGTGPDGAMSTTSYDSNDQPASSTDANGNTTTTLYEELNGNPQGEKVVSGPGGTTTFVYDDSQVADGIHIIDETGPNGVTTITRYDLQYRLLENSKGSGVLLANCA